MMAYRTKFNNRGLSAGLFLLIYFCWVPLFLISSFSLFLLLNFEKEEL